MPFPDDEPEPADGDDKAQHAIAGAAALWALEEAMAKHGKTPHPAMRLVTPAAVGVAKEFADGRMQGRTVDPMDAVATAIGGALSYRSPRVALVPILSPERIAVAGRVRF